MEDGGDKDEGCFIPLIDAVESVLIAGIDAAQQTCLSADAQQRLKGEAVPCSAMQTKANQNKLRLTRARIKCFCDGLSAGISTPS
jgi:hypothetical protein